MRSQGLLPLGQRATVSSRKSHFDHQNSPFLGPFWALFGPFWAGGLIFPILSTRNPFIKKTPFFDTSKAPPLDVTISLRRFLRKMASVRQILPSQPGKDALSDPYDPRPSHCSIRGFACHPWPSRPFGPPSGPPSEGMAMVLGGLNRSPTLFNTASFGGSTRLLGKNGLSQRRITHPSIGLVRPQYPEWLRQQNF